MPRQDVDPLADTQPPRYAYESDDEDETGLANLTSGAATDAPKVEITFLPPIGGGKDEEDRGDTLIIASGGVGAAWARGANLGEQVGQVNVNKRAIGLVFRPVWAGPKGTVVVSEALTRLPVWVMSHYAASVLERWKPSRVVLLDAYSTATYISATPTPHQEAPLRYLSTDLKVPSSKVPVQLFAPPNLLQSTTAAFLNLLSLPKSSSERKPVTGLAILAPSSRVPLPIPRTLSRDEEGDSEEQTGVVSTDLSGLEDSGSWDPALLREAHHAVLELAAVANPSEEWTDLGTTRSRRGSARSHGRRRLTEAEEGMYI